MLDAGCGWGLAGVYCARRGARVVGFDIDPEVLPIAQFHAQYNHVTISTQTRGFDAVDADMLNGVSWVVGADICFRGDLIDPLFGLAERACAAGVRMAIADPGRPPPSDAGLPLRRRPRRLYRGRQRTRAPRRLARGAAPRARSLADSRRRRRLARVPSVLSQR